MDAPQPAFLGVERSLSGRRWYARDCDERLSLAIAQQRNLPEILARVLAGRGADLAKGDVMFAATGVTTGSMLRGVRRFHGGAETHSLVMRSKTGTVRYITGRHNFNRKSGFDA